MPATGYIGMSSSGCLLPVLIILNLIFGKLIFDSTGLWLGVEAVLILIFMLKVKLMVSRISQYFNAGSRSSSFGRPQSQNRGPIGKIIDVQGQEVNDENELS